MNYMTERFNKLRLTAIPVDVPVPSGYREKVMNAIDALSITAEQDCYGDSRVDGESCQCTPCMAKYQIQQLNQIFEVHHDTINPDRLGNLFEQIFLEKWKQLNKPERHQNGHCTLELILSPTRQEPSPLGFFRRLTPTYVPPITQRDAQVAATVIQWLGSPIGGCFLRDAEREIEAKRKITHEHAMGLTELGLKDIPDDIAIAREIACRLCPPDHEEFEPLVRRLANTIQRSAELLVTRQSCSRQVASP